jgi:uncharacterized protein
VRSYIEGQDIPEVSFAWQGGEPTLMGVDFFRRAVAFQKLYANGKRITNAFQTNGTLLNDEWCEFLAENQFLIGLSVDGPRELHDCYRVDKHQKPTFDLVMRGLSLLKKHRVEFNTLTVVHDRNSREPLKVYHFLKNEAGSKFMQFIPLVERQPDAGAQALNLTLAQPPMDCETPGAQQVTSWSVKAADYGKFLISVFDEWVHRDVGTVFIQHFDTALSIWSGLESPVCVFREKCGDAMILEHDGRVYSCDHFMYPQYDLGNVLESPLSEITASPRQRAFGDAKADTLPQYCRKCEVRFACNGECPKHRFIETPDGEKGLNYLCEGYKAFFKHIDPHMKVMARLLRERRAPATIMQILNQYEYQAPAQTRRRPRPNDDCPCGSGRKYKKCCSNR